MPRFRLRNHLEQPMFPLTVALLLISAVCLGSWVWRQRTELRERYNIPGSSFKDLISAFCCTCVAVMQQENEVALRNERARAPGPDTAGYQPHQGMEMQPVGQPQQDGLVAPDSLTFQQQPYQQQPPPKN